jgi:hypothetical protein
MKTSAWIKLIGILCIIFGASGILTDIVSLLFPEMTGRLPEASPDTLRWLLKLPFISLLANIIYLMAGIFFLKKKTFSLKLMYIALTLSILCRIVPMLFFSQNSSIPVPNYEINIFSLSGPFIDVLLLIGVSRLAKYYYKPEYELIKPFGEYAMTPRLLRFMTFLGFVCLSSAMTIQGLWIYSASSEKSQVEMVTKFNSFFPDFLHGRYTLNYIGIALCILTIFISTISLKSSGIIWKTNMIILIFSSLLLFLNFFQMM